MRLRTELDGLHVSVPAASPRQARPSSVRFLLGVGRPLAVALGVALLLGSVAWGASGSPNPANWVKAAERTLGIPVSGDKVPLPRPTESPEPTEKTNGTEREATDGRSPEPAEQRSPEPASPEGTNSSDPAEHSPTTAAGDG